MYSPSSEIIIPNVSVGRYTLHLWYDGIPPDKLDLETREFVVSERSATLEYCNCRPVGRWKRIKINTGATTILPRRLRRDMTSAEWFTKDLTTW